MWESKVIHKKGGGRSFSYSVWVKVMYKRHYTTLSIRDTREFPEGSPWGCLLIRGKGINSTHKHATVWVDVCQKKGKARIGMSSIMTDIERKSGGRVSYAYKKLKTHHHIA